MKKVIKINSQRYFRKNRVRAKVRGTDVKPRLSIFRSNKNLYVQLIDDSAGKTLAAVRSEKGLKRASVLGQKIAELAQKNGVKTAVFDRGQYKFHGQIKAVAEGARAAGLKI